MIMSISSQNTTFVILTIVIILIILMLIVIKKEYKRLLIFFDFDSQVLKDLITFINYIFVEINSSILNIILLFL